MPIPPADTVIELHAPDPAWARLARRESARLADAMGGNVVRIEHIGSTAIPGIAAKPIVDLLPIVRSLVALDAAADALRSLGYAWWGEYGIPGRRFCTLSHPQARRRIANVHCFEVGSAHIDRHVAFRDYLRAHPDQARAYEAQKRQAAAQHPDDVLAYNEAKSPWIKACEVRALAWRKAGVSPPPAEHFAQFHPPG